MKQGCSQAKAGTTTLFAHATSYVVCRNKRVTLAIHAVHRQKTLMATITYLLAMLHPLKLRVKRLYLNQGFYSVPVIRRKKALKLPFFLDFQLLQKGEDLQLKILNN